MVNIQNYEIMFFIYTLYIDIYAFFKKISINVHNQLLQ